MKLVNIILSILLLALSSCYFNKKDIPHNTNNLASKLEEKRIKILPKLELNFYYPEKFPKKIVNETLKLIQLKKKNFDLIPIHLEKKINIVFLKTDIFKKHFSVSNWISAIYVNQSIFIKINNNNPQNISELIMHEISHALVDNPKYKLPIWMDEGLATVIAEQFKTQSFVYLAQMALDKRNLNIKKLNQNFLSTNKEISQASYLLAGLLVNRLIKRHGITKFKELLVKPSEFQNKLNSEITRSFFSCIYKWAIDYQNTPSLLQTNQSVCL